MNYDSYVKSGAMHKAVGDATCQAFFMDKMLSLVQSISGNSLHIDSQNFDSRNWLNQWIEIQQPALGGLKPSELLDTETGRNSVLQLLGAMESGSFQ
jgi:Protein of unknown function (DUF2384)